jgi:hypothetical protein
MTSDQYDAIIIGGGMRGAEAACSVHGSPLGWRNESLLADFHELRQDFSPTDKAKGIIYDAKQLRRNHHRRRAQWTCGWCLSGAGG